MATKLSAEERETVIVTSDADDYWTISTHQKPKVTQLEKMVRNGNAEKLEDLTFEGQAGGMYRIPMSMVTLRNPKPKVARSTRTRPDIKTRCKGKTQSGRPCNAIPGPTGYCFKHKDQRVKE